MKALDIVTLVLVLVGALNWGLVGVFDFNLVGFLFGPLSVLSRIIYLLVGLSAFYQAVAWRPNHMLWCRLQHVPSTH